jgi:hypothetical protein
VVLVLVLMLVLVVIDYVAAWKEGYLNKAGIFTSMALALAFRRGILDFWQVKIPPTSDILHGGYRRWRPHCR